MEFIIPIIAPNQVRKIYETLNKVVRHSSEGDILLRKQAGWIAVPVESYSNITSLNEEQLKELLLVRGYQNLFAVALELLGDLPSTYVVPTTVKGIGDYALHFSSFYFALFAGEPDWVIIQTVDEFDILAGPADFINQLINCEPEKALEDFKEHAQAFPIVPMKVLRERMLYIHSYFRDNYPDAKVGSEFSVIKILQQN